MKPRTKEMLNEIDEKHDWMIGNTYTDGGLAMHSTDKCRVCAMKREWRTDRQNGIEDEYTFIDGLTGKEISLGQAVARKCE